MKQSDWKDREIEDLIRKLPKVKDNQSPEYLYSKIKVRKQKSFTVLRRFIPTFALIAALFIIVLLSPSILNQSNDSSSGANKTADHSSEDRAEEAEMSKSLYSDAKDTTSANDTQLSMSEEQPVMTPQAPDRLSLFQEDLTGKEYYTFGLISKDAIPVPVTVVTNKEPSFTSLEQFEKMSKNLPQAEWGMDEYLPFKGEFREGDSENEVVFTIAENHSYSGSSAIEYAFYHSLLYSFRYKDVTKIQIVNKDGSVPQFSTMGELSTIDLTNTIHSPYYLYTPNGKDRYLVQDNIDRGNVSEAINAMKNPDSSLFQTVIPENINMSITESNEYVTIEFQEELNMNSLDAQSALEMIEGLLLTAKSSGYNQVLFENIKEKTWNGFNFEGPITAPVSPNVKDIEE
ncbi:hypothetical protein [Rossellomorea aquimaris]|uniref:hypothetical protein n=1 Tax=Rossellomorea aquimaris TaxID=189382 RepID=UPI0007D07B6D|nr:hypothetical protein [Rossellomorea aquimaris]